MVWHVFPSNKIEHGEEPISIFFLIILLFQIHHSSSSSSNFQSIIVCI